jgi:hypothetical protein
MHAKYVVLLAFFVAGTGLSTACDFCNCVMGINPYYVESDAIHVSTLFQRSSGGGSEVPHTAGDVPVGKILSGGIGGPGSILHDEAGGAGSHSETKNTIEIAYRYHLLRNVLVSGFFPYHTLRVRSATEFSIGGPGDLTLIAQYVSRTVVGDKTPATLVMGGGLQLPTGSNSRRDPEGELLEPHMQLGSGSLNYVLSMTATVQPDRWTLALDLFGKLSTRNKRNDRLGNSLALSGFVSRELFRDEYSRFALVGNGGIRGEFAARDIVAGIRDSDTGFTSLYGNLGVQIYFSFLRVDFTVLIPISQDRPANGLDEQARFVSGVRIEL